MSNYSQFGQAEWLLQLCRALGINNGSVFEAGASSPHRISNARCFLDHSWKAYLVEASAQSCEEWNLLGLPDAIVINESIKYVPDGLEKLLSSINAPADLDVMFLDVDGAEYQFLEGMVSFRPKFVCVEYDNSYPLSIDFVPKQMRHSVASCQCSSMAIFRLMGQKGYTYVTSFCLDHIFISNEFLDKKRTEFDRFDFAIGQQAFAKKAQKNLYNFESVLLNQDDNNGGSGIRFYRVKLQNLIDNGLIEEARHYYWFLSQVFQAFRSVVSKTKVNCYQDAYIRELEDFDDCYSLMLLVAN